MLLPSVDLLSASDRNLLSNTQRFLQACGYFKEISPDTSYLKQVMSLVFSFISTNASAKLVQECKRDAAVINLLITESSDLMEKIIFNGQVDAYQQLTGWRQQEAHKELYSYQALTTVFLPHACRSGHKQMLDEVVCHLLKYSAAGRRHPWVPVFIENLEGMLSLPPPECHLEQLIELLNYVLANATMEQVVEILRACKTFAFQHELEDFSVHLSELSRHHLSAEDAFKDGFYHRLNEQPLLLAYMALKISERDSEHQEVAKGTRRKKLKTSVSAPTLRKMRSSESEEGPP